MGMMSGTVKYFVVFLKPYFKIYHICWHSTYWSLRVIFCLLKSRMEKRKDQKDMTFGWSSDSCKWVQRCLGWHASSGEYQSFEWRTLMMFLILVLILWWLCVSCFVFPQRGEILWVEIISNPEWVLSHRRWEVHMMTSVCFSLLLSKNVVFLTGLNSQQQKQMWVVSKQPRMAWILQHRHGTDYHRAEREGRLL